MRMVLETVPDNLEKLFDNLLSQDDARRIETIVLLQWVLLSQRPLRLEELYFGMVGAAVPKSVGRWDRCRVTRDVMQRRITRSSRGLIEVRKGRLTNDADQEEASVQFIHQSVNDFLLRNQRLQKLDATLTPDPIRASHGRLWACCWRYILQVDTTLISKEDMQQLNQDYPFLFYTAKHIFDHAEAALAEETMAGWIRGEASREAISAWLQGRNCWFGWWKMFVNTSEEYSDLRYDVEAGLLYIISRRGYRGLVRMVLVDERVDADVNIEAGYYGTALQAASIMGHTEVVRMLLDAGAHVNIEAGYYGTALQAASANGKIEVVRMLLDAGAHVNIEAGYFGTALQAASANGHTEVVRMLLGAGAYLNIEAGHHGTALQAASAGGQTEIMRMLLDAGAYLNIEAGHYGTALQAASIKGHTEAVRMCLMLAPTSTPPPDTSAQRYWRLRLRDTPRSCGCFLMPASTSTSRPGTSARRYRRLRLWDKARSCGCCSTLALTAHRPKLETTPAKGDRQEARIEKWHGRRKANQPKHAAPACEGKDGRTQG